MIAKEQALSAMTRDVGDVGGGGAGSYFGLVSAIALSSVFWTVIAGYVCRLLDASLSPTMFAIAAGLLVLGLTAMAAPIFFRAAS